MNIKLIKDNNEITNEEYREICDRDAMVGSICAVNNDLSLEVNVYKDDADDEVFNKYTLKYDMSELTDNEKEVFCRTLVRKIQYTDNNITVNNIAEYIASSVAEAKE